jgi:hypothetical protein
MDAVGSDVSLFWLDSLGTGLSLIGTQLHTESREVVWAKHAIASQSERVISPLTLEFHPQPYDPASHATAYVTFSIPSEDVVHCVLYDALGREVGMVYDGIANAGSHTERFSLSNPKRVLSSGLYILRLTSGAYTVSQRVLIRF